ncbi:MAG: hypothetical protein KJ970_01445 [Candidatus Eisenbacteria bacterium]|uniref:Uncharacterized protein n=1 Tax=Eiseniibacteriota bacterium TaxID=2212470 RepID=A0A948RU88_UNCEI|nr:hypothetical protein [Candidatus Eisenbacteria bacterium]MBU1949411.1 hypothetical protein [Candidatus Eisenbacteria bacterium]MBU2689567.1 hypothetical protein [Candidatus Eisenbacteria bacterium]
MNFRRSILIVVCIGLLIYFPKSSLASGSLSGHAGIVTYSYGDTAETGQSELLTQLSFKVEDDSGFALRFNGRMREPLTDGPIEDWNLYRGTLEWASHRKRLSMTVGRRLLYTGILRGIQDGLVIEMRRLHRPTGLNVTLAVGKEASHGLETGPADNPNPWTLGVIASVHPLRTLDIKLSSRFNLEDKEEGAAFSDILGVSAGWRPVRTLLLDGLLEHDSTRERVERGQTRISYSSADYTLSAEYLYAASPWIPADSWFSRFDELIESYSQYRVGFDAGVPSVDWLSAGLYWIAQEGDERSINGYFSAWRDLTLGYRFSGDGDTRKGGVYGNAGRHLTGKIRIDAGADFSKYKIYSLYDQPAYGSYLRLGYDPTIALHLFSEVQYRKDQLMDKDFRLLMGASYRFNLSYGNRAN